MGAMSSGRIVGTASASSLGAASSAGGRIVASLVAASGKG